jgi:hypothetical protein
MSNKSLFSNRNWLPALEDIPNRQLPEDYGLSSRYKISKDDPQYASQFSSVQKNDWYVKVGRTTHITAGICNGTEACIPRPNGSHYDEQGKLLEPGKLSTLELVVLSRENKSSQAGDQITQIDTCLRGDSGAFMIDTNGDVAGFLYGFITGHCGSQVYVNSALVSCMTDILPSVAAKTTVVGKNGAEIQGELSLPQDMEFQDSSTPTTTIS